jgi:hypothetical protein
MVITDTIPNDKYQLVWWIFVAMGVATLLPWNITINQCAPYYVNHKISGANRALRELENILNAVNGQNKEQIDNGCQELQRYYNISRISFGIADCAKDLVILRNGTMALIPHYHRWHTAHTPDTPDSPAEATAAGKFLRHGKLRGPLRTSTTKAKTSSAPPTTTPHNYHVLRSHYNLSDDDVDEEATNNLQNEMPAWEEYFCDAAVLCNQIPVVGVAGMYALMGSRINEKVVIKNLIAIAIMVGVQMTNAGLAVANTTDWTEAFLIISLALIIVTSIAANIFSAGSWLTVSMLPETHSGAILTGQAMSGVLVTLIAIIITALGLLTDANNGVVAAIIFAVVGLFIGGIIIAYKIMLDNAFFVYHSKEKIEKILKASKIVTVLEDGQTTVEEPLVQPSPQQPPAKQQQQQIKWSEIIAVLKPNWLRCLNLFTCFYATLALFPGITMWVLPKALNESAWNLTLWNQVWCFLTFNIMNIAGVLLMGKFMKRGAAIITDPRLMIINLARMLIGGALIMLCNVQIPGTANYGTVYDYTLPDIVFIIVMLIFSIMHGLISALATHSIMTQFSQTQKEAAKNAALIIQLTVALSITAGLATTPILKLIYAQ